MAEKVEDILENGIDMDCPDCGEPAIYCGGIIYCSNRACDHYHPTVSPFIS